MTGELNGQRKLGRAAAMRNGNRTHVCRACGGEGTASVKLFILALDGSGRQLRGYWHPRCFKKVQRHIIVAARKWVLSGEATARFDGCGLACDAGSRS